MRRALIAIAAAAIALPAAAHAEPPFRKLGPGEIWTDGERYAVMSRDAIPRRAFDDRTGTSYPIAPPADECTIMGIAAGTVLWSCRDGDPMLMALDSGTSRPVPGWDAVIDSYDPPPLVNAGPLISGFGAHWIQVEIHGWSALLASRWIDWHDGRIVSDALGATTSVIDLDSTELTRPLCAPLRRRVERDGGVELPVPHVYERPWLFVPWPFFSTKRVVTVRRCGRRGRVVLARCRPRCRNLTMGAGWVTWARGDWAYAYDLRRERRRRVGTVTQQPSLVDLDFNIWHTRNRMYLQTGGFASSVYVAALRRRGS
jgi:hypothetical protein